MLMDPSFFRPLVYGLADADAAGFRGGRLSAGQSWLEELILALGTAATWASFGGPNHHDASVGPNAGHARHARPDRGAAVADSDRTRRQPAAQPWRCDRRETPIGRLQPGNGSQDC
jgi:hypothetical protein